MAKPETLEKPRVCKKGLHTIPVGKRQCPECSAQWREDNRVELLKKKKVYNALASTVERGKTNSKQSVKKISDSYLRHQLRMNTATNEELEARRRQIQNLRERKAHRHEEKICGEGHLYTGVSCAKCKAHQSYERNKHKYLPIQYAKQKANRPKANEYNKAYYQRYLASNRERNRILQKNRRSTPEGRAAESAIQKRHNSKIRALITDRYLRKWVPVADVEFLAAKRVHLQITRFIKEMKK